MRITYHKGIDGPPINIEPELLVIACDPRGLDQQGVIDYTAEEREIVDALRSFTFFTTCVRVRPSKGVVQDRIVILDPVICGQMIGDVHGYRNETAKQWGLSPPTGANGQDTNLVTVYQIVKPDMHLSKDDLLGILKTFLLSPAWWWPFEADDGTNCQIVSVEEHQPNGDSTHPAANPLDTPYFNQFYGPDLAKGRPWQWLDLQGDNKTIYVHASTCFESVLHCWSYIQILMTTSKAKGALPGVKGAPIVIAGAGVSGLLFAWSLNGLGYTNVTLLEATDRYGGKTHSLRVTDAPGTTIGELGTCYMSPAYDDMVTALASFTAGNERRHVCTDDQRGMVFRGTDGTEMVVGLADYGKRYACQWLGVSYDVLGRAAADIALAVAFEQYLRLRLEIFGSFDGVMPLPMPQGDPYGVFSKTFAQFLDDNEMGVLMSL